MTVDLTKLILNTNFNSFKNVNSYSGTLTLPASVPPATLVAPYAIASSSVTLTEPPVFTAFFAYFNEFSDALNGFNNPQWYNAATPGGYNVAYPALLDVVNGNLGFFMGPIINGSTVTIQAQTSNTTATTYAASVTVPWVFVQYTLAN